MVGNGMKMAFPHAHGNMTSISLDSFFKYCKSYSRNDRSTTRGFIWRGTHWPFHLAFQRRVDQYDARRTVSTACPGRPRLQRSAGLSADVDRCPAEGSCGCQCRLPARDRWLGRWLSREARIRQWRNWTVADHNRPLWPPSVHAHTHIW